MQFHLLTLLLFIGGTMSMSETSKLSINKEFCKKSLLSYYARRV